MAIKSYILHSYNFTDEEFKLLGESSLHKKTELFYIEYGIDKAIKYYTDAKEEIRTRYGKNYTEHFEWSDIVGILTKLLVLKEIVEKKMKYSKEYFIEKFESIPDENWLENGDLFDPEKENCGCALFHCGVREGRTKNDLKMYIPSEEALALIQLFGGHSDKDNPDYRAVYRVNDSSYIHNITPKQAILKKLYSLR